MCAVTSIVDRSVRSIESIDGRYGGCWRRSSPKPPSHKPRRRLNSSSTPGPVDCARAVWRETLSWVPFGAAPPQVTRLPPPDNPLQTAPFLIARYDDARAKPTHARALRRRRRSLARSRARCVAVARWRSVTPPVTRVTRAARHARARVRHHRASRASSPFSVPPPRTHARAARCDGARSLARSLARGAVWRWRWRWRSVTPRVTRVTRARVHVITAHRARHHRPPSPMSPMRARGSGGGAVSFARLLARAEAEAVGLGEAVGYIARHACQTRHARRSSRARTRISSPLRARHHRFPSPPRTTGTRALLRRRRSLARSIARTRCGVGGGGGVQLHRASRASRASRARACTSSPRIARVITAPLPRCHPCARAAAAAALSRLLACSRARRRRRTVIRTSCVSRASRARARASSSSRHLLAPLPLKCAPFAAVSSSLLSSLSSSLSSSLRARITTKRPATCE